MEEPQIQKVYASWAERVQKAASQKINSRVFTAFNTNVDVVVHVNNENLNRVLANNPNIISSGLEEDFSRQADLIKTPEEFLSTLLGAMEKGKSLYTLTNSDDLLDWLCKSFPDAKEILGGQAGIVANQISSLGTQAVVYSRLMPPQQAALFKDEVLVPTIKGNKLVIDSVKRAARQSDQCKINWIFEYGKGVTVNLGGFTVTTPRANRVILATRPKNAIMSFSDEMMEHLPELGKQIDLAFMAGYHYIEEENPDGRSYQEFLDKALKEIELMRSKNPNLAFHYEYVPMKARNLEAKTLAEIGNTIESFGINENELKLVLDDFNFQEEKHALEKSERAYTLYKAALPIFRKMNLKRLHVHNLGYYVVIISKSYHISPQRCLEACLYASSVNALKAKYGGFAESKKLPEAGNIPLSEIGFKQLLGIKEEMDLPSEFLETGIYEGDDHYLLVVPAHVIPNPVSTVGMGDTISSTSFALEYSNGEKK
ncbi:MAG: ADP-dependent glucokinase/phosphofructokinase [Firmicutes bacterium]|nr:ADP-dependent glucokinase/phosphofructokinase [Bacillota bacterium]MDD4264317.1 ADP-dependent glucokinase/phosphofructokinase [Bacillota bacterium]MDD4692998.1 ADP-dependent glucokinase/phosphofructokinase [Bacillota bacterium]